MSYEQEHLIRLLDINLLALRVIDRIRAIENSLAANVTASTDADADYASEVVDARIDSKGGQHASAGANLRWWQEDLKDTNEYLQAQIDEISEAVIKTLNQLGAVQERIRGLEQQERGNA